MEQEPQQALLYRALMKEVHLNLSALRPHPAESQGHALGTFGCRRFLLFRYNAPAASQALPTLLHPMEAP